MIIGSLIPLELGKTHTGDYRVTEKESLIVTVLVVRPSTFEEWELYRAREGRQLTSIPRNARDYHYYEVMTD